MGSTDYYGRPYWIFRDNSGKAQRLVPPGVMGFNDEGVSWVENNLLCDHWGIDTLSIPQCMTIFRNPDRPTSAEDEYIAVSDFGVQLLSPLD